MGDEFAVGRDGKRAGWEGMGCDCLSKEVEGGAKPFLLRSGVARQKGKTCGRV